MSKKDDELDRLSRENDRLCKELERTRSGPYYYPTWPIYTTPYNPYGGHWTSVIFFRLKRLSTSIKNAAEELDLNKEIEVNHQDELGAVSIALNEMMNKFRVSFMSIAQASEQLTESAKEVDKISTLTLEAVLEQKKGTDSVAAAINELDTSANEVQHNTQSAADKSVSANERTSQGLVLVEQAKLGINELRDKVIENTAMITD